MNNTAPARANETSFKWDRYEGPLKRRKGWGQASVLLKAGACDGSLSASLSPRGPQVCPFKVPETLRICADDTVLTAPFQQQAPRGPHLALRGPVWSADCTIRCKHCLSIKTSPPPAQTRGSALRSGRNRHWPEPKLEETSVFPSANHDPEKHFHTACTHLTRVL